LLVRSASLPACQPVPHPQRSQQENHGSKSASASGEAASSLTAAAGIHPPIVV
jgi:hypothetical protein